MKRRGFLLGSLASLLAGWARKAQAGFTIFQIHGSGPFVPNLIAIDGGSTYYADQGFSTAAAVMDSPTFFPVGFWFNYLDTSAKFNLCNDLHINFCNAMTSITLQNGAGVNANQANVGANGSNPWGGLWLTQSIEDPTVASFAATAGAETLIVNTWDEATSFSAQIQAALQGTLVAPANGSVLNTITTPQAAALLSGRPIWNDFTLSYLASALGGTPAPGTIAAMFYSTTTCKGGAVRKLDLTSFDCYWIAGASDPWGLCSCKGAFGGIYKLNGVNSQTLGNANPTSTSITIPTSFPTTITFTTTTNLGVQLGTACILERGGGGGYAACIGTVTAYASSTGVCSIRVDANHTYTCTIPPGGFINNGGGPNSGTLPLNVIQISQPDSYAWLSSGAPVITDVTTPGNIPGGTTFQGGNAVANFNNGAFGSTFNTAWNLFTSANTTVAANDVIAIASTITTGGVGPFTDFAAHFAMTQDQARRATRYGDMIDAQRGFQYNTTGSPTRIPAPILQFPETMGPFQNQIRFQDYITPFEMNAAAWASIMHGCRNIAWFNATFGGPNIGEKESTQSTYGQSVPGGTDYFGRSQTISWYDQMRATNRCIFKLAAVINAKFARGYCTVSPNGFEAPWATSYAQNDTPAVFANFFNADLACVNGVNTTSFEVMTKLYQGSSSGLLVNGSYYIFAMYRGSASDINKTATFTLSTTPATVTRIYVDGVIAAAASPVNPATLTRVTVGDTSQMSTNDTALIELTAGVTGLNATFTNNITVIDGQHIDVPLAFSGSLTTHGTITVTHNISVASGSFTDTFTKGTDVRIYRTN